MITQTVTESPRTTLWGGGILVASALIAFLASLHFALPLDQYTDFPFAGTVPLTISNLVMVLSLTVLAFGVRGEAGIAGSSVLGRVALVVFGAGYLLFRLYLLVPGTETPGSTLAVIAGSALELLVIVAGVVAGVVVLRAHVLHGGARWMLLVVSVWDAACGLMIFVPSVAFALNLAIWQVEVLIPAAHIVLGVTYVLHGRSAAIRHRLRTIYEQW